MRKAILTRILERVVVNRETGCWEWQGNRQEFGYGRIKYNGKLVRVHRLMYTLTVSEVGEGLCVCHHCDNPPCCNPQHLFLRTRGDNAVNRHLKGRDAKGEKHGRHTRPERTAKGEQQGIAKLTEEQVVKIRGLYTPHKISQRRLAKEFNVSRRTIRDILIGKQWKHLL